MKNEQSEPAREREEEVSQLEEVNFWDEGESSTNQCPTCKRKTKRRGQLAVIDLVQSLFSPSALNEELTS